MFPSQARLYGKGIFTTIAFRNGKLLFWEKHWRRIIRNAEASGIDLTEYTEAEVLSQTADAISASRLADGRVRLTFADEAAGPHWPAAVASGSTDLDILVGGTRSVTGPLRLGLSPYLANSTSPLAGVKSCNYLENILAIDEAKSRGFQEAVRLNESGHITGGSMANIFWLKGEELFTPSLSTGCLPGTTREFVLENLDCAEVEAELKDLNYADAVYLTSAGLGVAAVDELNGKQLPNPPHPITELLAEL